MILELDLGNSRAKWRLLATGQKIDTRGSGNIDEWLKGELPPAWSNKQIERIRIASVLAADVEQLFAERLYEVLGLTAEFARTSSSCAEVKNSYSDPGRLGVDRWLAMLAAYNTLRVPVLIADIGSALTIDLVDRSGRHCGGYIIPGPRLMQRSLLRETDRVRFSEFNALSASAFGCDTESCVGAGIAAALAGSVIVALQHAKVQVRGGLSVFLTGGWGQELSGYLRMLECEKVIVVPELVLDGLRWALP